MFIYAIITHMWNEKEGNMLNNEKKLDFYPNTGRVHWQAMVRPRMRPERNFKTLPAVARAVVLRES
jgi:hypothetical protein